MNATPSVQGPAILKGPMATLVRRELWEHRALWIAPLVVAGLLLFGVITGAVLGHGELAYDSGADPAQNRAALAIGILSFAMPQYLVMLLMLFFYLLDCLYTERKDRSILFWKSMPVSDTATVLSKLLTAMVVVPLGVFVVSLATDLIVAAILMTSVHGGSAIWDTVTWLKIRGAMIPGLVLMLLWYAPVAAYLMLVSAWARRAVFLWVALPPLILILVENRATGTHYVATFLQYRLAGIWRYFGSDGSHMGWRDGLPNVGALVQHVGGTRALMDADLWLGLLAAAALTFAAVRIRRYRDDT